MKRFILAAAAALVLTSCGRTLLPKDNWNPVVWETLENLIETSASGDSYAVFDFDNTSAINDIEHTTMEYALENLRFAIEPDRFFTVITEGLPDIDTVICEQDGRQLTVRMFADDASKDYRYLYDNYISRYEDVSGVDAKAALESVRLTDEFLDFRAKMWACYDGICNTFPYAVECLWILTLYDGMTAPQIQSLVKEALKHYMTVRPMGQVVWESPEMGEAGKVSSSHPEGFAITPEMQHLYKALKENGIDVYVCSASLETIVEAAACDPEFGFGQDTSRVYGLRMASGSGVHHAEYSTDYIQTYREGKSAAIRAYMAPSHGGHGPVLVAGDSNGDFSMLSSFDDLKVGLIIDCGNGGSIGKLMNYARTGEKPSDIAFSPSASYVVQSRDFANGRFVR